MGIIEFFTNGSGGTKEDVKAPAFSLTKVQAGLGLLVTAGAGAMAKIEADDTIKVAALAAGTLILLGVFALAAVDLIARQRAAEATLRYGSPAPGTAEFTALPEHEELVLQSDTNTGEYKLRMAEVKGDTVTLIGRRDGETLSETFQRSNGK